MKKAELPFFKKAFVAYVVKFLTVFCLLFYGTEAVIAFSSPGDHYIPFFAVHLNFVDPFRDFLLVSSQSLLSLFGFKTYIKEIYTLTLVGGHGVRLVYTCLGYGVLSFWTAFVFANRGSFQKKAIWIVGGSVLLIALNILRISLLLIATNRDWPIPLGLDHHTWFNIIAYGCIIGMIYAYDRISARHSGKWKESSETRLATNISG